MSRRTLLISNYNVDRRYWNGIAYDIARVVAETESGAICAPAARHYATPASLWRLLADDRYRLGQAVRDVLMMRWTDLAEPHEIDADCDLCFVVLFFPSDLRFLERIRGWRERSKIAAVFLLELWSGEVEAARDLSALDRFDHVFLVNDAAVPLVQARTRTPVSQLSLAVDALRAAPAPVDGRMPRRRIDILSYGRRQPDVHARLVEIAARQGLFYKYDVWAKMLADDWETTRAMSAELTRRSRYAVVWGPTIAPAAHKIPILRDDRMMSARFFEATAGGAIMLGDYHSSPVIDRLIDWPDAMVRIRPDGSDVEATLDALEADPARRARIRAANVLNGLRRHDWSHRWADALATLGLTPVEGFHARQAALAARAAVVEATP